MEVYFETIFALVIIILPLFPLYFDISKLFQNFLSSSKFFRILTIFRLFQRISIFLDLLHYFMTFPTFFELFQYLLIKFFLTLFMAPERNDIDFSNVQCLFFCAVWRHQRIYNVPFTKGQ